MKKIIWLPRIILIIQILFFGIFSFDSDIRKLLIYLIPVYILTIILLVSWKSPSVAAFLSLITMIGFAIFFNTTDYYMKFLIITLPQFVVFILFTLSAIFGKTKEEKEIEKKEEEIIEEYRRRSRQNKKR